MVIINVVLWSGSDGNGTRAVVGCLFFSLIEMFNFSTTPLTCKEKEGNVLEEIVQWSIEKNLCSEEDEKSSDFWSYSSAKKGDGLSVIFGKISLTTMQNQKSTLQYIR